MEGIVLEGNHKTRQECDENNTNIQKIRRKDTDSYFLGFDQSKESLAQKRIAAVGSKAR